MGGIILSIDNSDNIYRCPVCRMHLFRQEKQYVCSKGHNFDIAGNGYVNLLMGNQKKTKDPGDNKDMMECRRDFLNKGYYNKFAEEFSKSIEEYINNNSGYILDAGCGEGYFISKLKDYFSMKKINTGISYYGIDISKSAIKYASKRDGDIHFAVASNFNLPILDNSLDCIIRNFAPSDNNEFLRVLRDSGLFFIATPGVEHLYELKEILYQKARKHELKNTAIEGFEHMGFRELKYDLYLDNNDDIKNLISMTPYYWTITEEMRNNINTINALNTTLHFNINIYRKL